jgi:hypothetical protein
MTGALPDHLWQSTMFAVVAGLLATALRQNRAHPQNRLVADDPAEGRHEQTDRRARHLRCQERVPCQGDGRHELLGLVSRIPHHNDGTCRPPSVPMT